MTGRLLLIRHAESTDNAAGRFGGRRDAGLSPEGERQRHRLAERLAHEKIDMVAASMLKRARMTAEAVAEWHGLPVVTLPNWEEASFGMWEGETFAKAESDYPEIVKAWMASPLTLAPPGGESFQDVYDRVGPALDDLLAKAEGKTVVLVAHGGSIRAAMVKVLGAELTVAEHIMIDHCGVAVVGHQNGYSWLHV